MSEGHRGGIRISVPLDYEVQARGDRFEAHLDDGTRVLFRPIRPTDKERLRAGFERLSPTSRYLRFFRHIDHLSEEQLRYLSEVDFENHFAWMAVLADTPGEPGVGVGRWIRMPGEPDVAEGAVTVADDYHNRGLGKTLLWLMARSAIQHGVRSFRAWTLGENHPMLELLKAMGARPGRWEGGVLELVVPLPEKVEDLNETPAPRVLKAAAAGHIEGEADPQRPAATRLAAPDRSR